MWSGEDQAPLDRPTTPTRDISSKAAFAAVSLSGGRRLAFGENRPARRWDLQDHPVLRCGLRELGHEDLRIAGPYPFKGSVLRLLEVEDLMCPGGRL